VLDTPEVNYTKDILRCLLLVNSPPTLLELTIIAGLPEEVQTDQKAIKNYVKGCGVLTRTFKVDANVAVQLSHQSIRLFLDSKSSDWLSMRSEQIQHGIIALRCFEYILDTVKDAYDDYQNVIKEEKPDMKDWDSEDEYDSDEDDSDEEDSDEDDGDENGNRHSNVVSIKLDNDVHTADRSNQPSTDDKNKNPKALDSNSTKPVKSKPLRYPYTQWIEHALQATPDIVENFGIDEVFWFLESKERTQWSKQYAKLNSAPESEFDAKFTALHVAAYFGYVPFADLLLNKSSSHDDEIYAVDSQGL